MLGFLLGALIAVFIFIVLPTKLIYLIRNNYSQDKGEK